MMKLEKKQVVNLLRGLPYRKNESAWNRGVKNYALDLIEELPDDYYFVSENASEVEENLKDLRKILLNGSNSWLDYSYDGCALIYDCDIAYVLCSPSELARTQWGEKQPNNYENWLDLQARALVQAWFLIKKVIRDFAEQYYN